MKRLLVTALLIGALNAHGAAPIGGTPIGGTPIGGTPARGEAARSEVVSHEPKETQTLVTHREPPTTAARAKARRAPAAQRVKVSGSVQKYYDKQRLKRFVHFLRIYSNPKSNHATKARAAHRLITLQKQIKNPSYHKYIAKELQRHHVTSADLQKAAQTSQRYLQFNHLVNKYAKRKKGKKFPKLHSSVDQQEAKTLTQIHSQLPADYQKSADRILKAKGVTLDELHQASQPMQKLTPAKPAEESSRPPATA